MLEQNRSLRLDPSCHPSDFHLDALHLAVFAIVMLILFALYGIVKIKENTALINKLASDDTKPQTKPHAKSQTSQQAPKSLAIQILDRRNQQQTNKAGMLTGDVVIDDNKIAPIPPFLRGAASKNLYRDDFSTLFNELAYHATERDQTIQRQLQKKLGVMESQYAVNTTLACGINICAIQIDFIKPDDGQLMTAAVHTLMTDANLTLVESSNYGYGEIRALIKVNENAYLTSHEN